MKCQFEAVKEKAKGALSLPFVDFDFNFDFDWEEVKRTGKDVLRIVGDVLRVVKAILDLRPNKSGDEKGEPEPVIVNIAATGSAGLPTGSALAQVVNADGTIVSS